MTAIVKGFGCRPVVDLYSRGEGRRTKASEEGTRGAGERFAVYGDLIGQRLGREGRWPASFEGKLALAVANWSALLRSTS